MNFRLDGTDLNPENEKGQEIILEKPKKTRKIKLFNFTQVTEILGFAALTQIEVYGRYIKEDFSKMEVRQASNAKDVKHYIRKSTRLVTSDLCFLHYSLGKEQRKVF